MVDGIVAQPFGLVFIVTAHMVLSDPGRAEVGIVGQNITLQFTFNTSVTKNSHIAIYKTREQKVLECFSSKFNSCEYVEPVNSSVFYHISNLTLNHTEVYWATLFENNRPPILSDKVQLIVKEENRSTTVPPMSTNFTKPQSVGSSSFFSSHVVTVLVVSPVMLLAVLLPFLICCLVKTKDRQQGEPQRSSNPTLQETIEVPINMPGPSLVYSILDFPKRPPAPVEFNSSGTEYATVSSLTEKRQRSHTNECKRA